MKNIKVTIAISLLAIVFLVACKSKKEVSAAAENNLCEQKVTFETLQPLLASSCVTSGCHDVGSKRMNFSEYSILKSFAERGEIKEHVLIEKNMPPNKKLSADELKQFRCWLENGMPEK